jgi:redox-sensitive bicupin YhaK (pirin superfamily)
VLFSEWEWFWAKAGGSGVLFLLLNGEPIREPITWDCPIVMNTREELSRAFQDLLEGTLIH